MYIYRMYVSLPCDGDDVFVRISLLGQLHVDLEVLPELLDDGSTPANDLGMVFGVDLQLDLVAARGFVLLFLLQLCDLLEESALGLLNVVGRAGDHDRVGLLLRAWNLARERKVMLFGCTC